jgi:hypothetical protein
VIKFRCWLVSIDVSGVGGSVISACTESEPLGLVSVAWVVLRLATRTDTGVIGDLSVLSASFVAVEKTKGFFFEKGASKNSASEFESSGSTSNITDSTFFV